MPTAFLMGAGGDYEAATEARLVEQILRRLDKENPEAAFRTRKCLGKLPRFLDLSDHEQVRFPFRMVLAKNDIEIGQFLLVKANTARLIPKGYDTLVFRYHGHYYCLHPIRKQPDVNSSYGRIHLRLKDTTYAVEPFVSFAESYAREIT